MPRARPAWGLGPLSCGKAPSTSALHTRDPDRHMCMRVSVKRSEENTAGKFITRDTTTSSRCYSREQSERRKNKDKLELAEMRDVCAPKDTPTERGSCPECVTQPPPHTASPEGARAVLRLPQEGRAEQAEAAGRGKLPLRPAARAQWAGVGAGGRARAPPSVAGEDTEWRGRHGGRRGGACGNQTRITAGSSSPASGYTPQGPEPRDWGRYLFAMFLTLL